jgi:CheY-like chemotaxis protein
METDVGKMEPHVTVGHLGDAKTILVVDDSATIRRAVEMVFLNTEYNVISSTSAPEALARLESVRPDIVLIDAAMPGTDGYELSEELRNRPRLRDIPILLMVNGAGPDTARSSDFDGHVQKPFGAKELLDPVKMLTGAIVAHGPLSFEEQLSLHRASARVQGRRPEDQEAEAARKDALDDQSEHQVTADAEREQEEAAADSNDLAEPRPSTPDELEAQSDDADHAEALDPTADVAPASSIAKPSLGPRMGLPTVLANEEEPEEIFDVEPLGDYNETSDSDELVRAASDGEDDQDVESEHTQERVISADMFGEFEDERTVAYDESAMDELIVASSPRTPMPAHTADHEAEEIAADSSAEEEAVPLSADVSPLAQPGKLAGGVRPVALPTPNLFETGDTEKPEVDVEMRAEAAGSEPLVFVGQSVEMASGMEPIPPSEGDAPVAKRSSAPLIVVLLALAAGVFLVLWKAL